MSETDKNAVWNTAITRVEPNKVAVRGYNIAELMGRVSFGAAVYLVLQGIATAGRRAFDGRDSGLVDRPRRDTSQRIGGADGGVYRRVVERVSCRWHYVDQPSSRRRD